MLIVVTSHNPFFQYHVVLKENYDSLIIDEFVFSGTLLLLASQ